MSFSQFGYPYSTTSQVRRVSSTHFCLDSAAAVQMSCPPSLFFFPFPYLEYFLKGHIWSLFLKNVRVCLCLVCVVSGLNK